MAIVDTESPAKGVLKIIFNRPEKRNAINPETRDALCAAVEAAVADQEVGAIILTGAGGNFSAGGDIERMEAFPAAAGRARLKLAHKTVKLIATCEKPIIAAVEGFAVGAGAGLALLADTIVMGEGATIGFPFFRIGVVPDYGVLYNLPKRIGFARAKQAMLYAQNIKGEEAAKIGLTDHLVADDQVQDKALELAQKLAGQPSHTLALAKAALRNLPLDLEASLEAEAMAQSLAFTHPDFLEGQAAFREKRKPNFS